MSSEIDRLNKKKKSPINAFLPVLGLLLAVSFGVLSWFLAPGLREATANQFSNFRGDELPEPYMTLAFAAFIFLMLMSFAGFTVALFAPKQKSKVKDKELLDARKELKAEKERRKRHRAKMSRAARDENRNRSR